MSSAPHRLPLLFPNSGLNSITTTYGQPNCTKQINQYVLLKKIGEGSSSRVFVARNSQTGHLFAIKRVHLKQLAKSSVGLSGIRREISLMSHISHPNIITLHEAIYVKETQAIYLVLDFAACGNLSSHLLPTEKVRFLFKQIINGVAYLHKCGIVHHDLKPANILLTEEGKALITDFGTGHSFQSCAQSFGTPAYQAPEVVNSTARDEVIHPGKEDVWSLGILLHFGMFRTLPFTGANVFEVARAAGSTPLFRPDNVDDELWDLMSKMLTVDPGERIGINEVLEHPWLRGAPETLELGLPVSPVGAPDVGLPIQQVRGEVLCKDGKFELPGLKKRTRYRSAIAERQED
jgi:serine/threonine protein kinase